jgi:lysyl-tRNA synthetase class II
MSIPFIEENDQTLARREHLEALRELVGNVYPNKFERSEVVDPGKEDTITRSSRSFAVLNQRNMTTDAGRARTRKPAAEPLRRAARRTHRVATARDGQGCVRSSFGRRLASADLHPKADVTGVHNDAEGGDVDGWALFQLLDHGDFIGVEGYLFVTKTGELSVHVQKLQFLSKALLPLPDKMHGIHDPEIKQRQRYADLIAGSLKLEKDETLNTARSVRTSRRRG